MADLAQTAPAFVDMAHKIVWCTVATVDKQGRPRSRVLHPVWEWDGEHLVGWIATAPTPTKVGHMQNSSFVSCNYWAPDQDTCVAECAASWVMDDDGKAAVWDKVKNATAPVGSDPAMSPGWENSRFSQTKTCFRFGRWCLVLPQWVWIWPVSYTHLTLPTIQL